MDWLDLFYFLLGAVIFFGAVLYRRGEWNEEYTSLKQTKMLTGIAALGVALHHIAQKSCASWHPKRFIVHGLDVFVDMGFILVAVFFFCSGLGLYKSFRTKPGYLKGFLRRRVLPLVIAYYLSEVIYLIIRAAMGEPMGAVDVIWYLSGLHMANMNAWYLVIIPLFYLIFWLAFRFCRHEGTAILWVFIGVLLYTVGCACVDHQNDWWIRGEWWYNSVILFPLGILFGRFEKPLTKVFRKGYILWLAASMLSVYGAMRLSDLVINHWGGFYGENWGDRLKVIHRLGSAGSQWLICIVVVWFCFLLMMKVRIGNRVLAWFGAVSLDFYLAHGVFVELFGYNFLDQRSSLVYIRDVPTYLLAVLSCGIVATLIFRLLRKGILRVTGLEPARASEPSVRREE